MAVSEMRPTVLCAQGPVPAAATVARLRDELGLTLVPGTGPLAAVVPGAVPSHGWQKSRNSSRGTAWRNAASRATWVVTHSCIASSNSS